MEKRKRCRVKNKRFVFLCVGLLAGSGALLAAEVPYVNWERAVPPVDERPLSIRADAKGDGHFGAPRSGHRTHRGVDFSAAMNSPVRTVRSGWVLEIGDERGFGRFVVVQHPGHLVTLYAHLSETFVSTGQRVKQGQQIGTVGKTGNAKHHLIQPHVHFEVIQAGQRLDPLWLGFAAPQVMRTQDTDHAGSSEKLPGIS